MAGILDAVDKRTQLVGRNRLELLLFKLSSNQQFGINVFKVREVLTCPNLTLMPKRHPTIRGVSHVRGTTINIIDLSMAIGGPPLQDTDNCLVIIAEYNRTTQGFLLRSVDKMINTNWEDIHPPPKGSGRSSYLTAVTSVDKELVEIIDVEKVLSEIVNQSYDVSDELIEERIREKAGEFKVLIADDSGVARLQVANTLKTIGVEVIETKDGREALSQLKQWADDGFDFRRQLLMVISDVEMPEMDGYTLTSEIRRDPRLARLDVMLHTSLSGVFNNKMIEQVAANDFIPKFKPDELAASVQERLSFRIAELGL